MTDYSMDIDTIETMFPFEREVYVAIIIQNIEKKKQNAA